MTEKRIPPSQSLKDFLDFVDQCTAEYQYASDVVNKEDRRIQDFLHEIEFESDYKKRNRIATRLHQSRKLRRTCKDLAKKNESVVKFFEEQANRGTLNKLRQLLGKQRKEEEYLEGERKYKHRVEGE